MPDCFNLKAISDIYKISADVLLETESDGDLDAVANWALSFVFFVVGYQMVAMIWRWRIRKESYNFLFEYHV